MDEEENRRRVHKQENRQLKRGQKYMGGSRWKECGVNDKGKTRE